MGNRVIFIPAVLVLAAAAWAQAGKPAPPRSQVAGQVTAVNAASGEITLQAAGGETVTASATERTQILRAVPGESDPRKWSRITLGEIGAGDRIVVYSHGAVGQKPLPASTIVVRTKADLAQIAEKQLEDWKKRGVSGTVASVDASGNTVVLTAGSRTLIVHPSNKTVWKRYSADSAKPADAEPSNIGEVKIGDQMHVLGGRSEDGAVTAESIYFGTFRQIAATVNSVEPARRELNVTDLASKKQLTIVLPADAVVKKLPEPVAQGLARRYQSTAAGGRGGGGGDIGQLLDRLPAISISELKPHDAIMVSTTAGSDPEHVSAVMLLAGVEPILRAAPTATRDIMSGWNLNAGGDTDDQ